MASVKLDVFNQCIENINKKFSKMENDLKTNKDEILSSICLTKADIQVEIEKLVHEVTCYLKIIDELEIRVDDLERDRISCDMIISGIPVINTVTPADHFENICNTLGFETIPKIVSIFRLKSSPSRKSAAPPIVVKFQNKDNKNHFFLKYKNFQNLMLKDIGLVLSNRIYCNDGLTKKNSLILSRAKQLEKLKVIQKSFTKRGLVYILLSKESQPALINKIEQLNETVNSTSATIVEAVKFEIAIKAASTLPIQGATSTNLETVSSEEKLPARDTCETFKRTLRPKTTSASSSSTNTAT